MIQQYGKEKGERVYHSYVNRRGLDDTKSMKGQKGTKMGPKKREDYIIPTKWEDYINRTKSTTTTESVSTTKTEQIMPTEEKKETLWEKAEEAAKASNKAVKTGEFKPWYMENRPFGAPKSPFQERTAQMFYHAQNEIDESWKEKAKQIKENEASHLQYTAFVKNGKQYFDTPKPRPAVSVNEAQKEIKAAFSSLVDRKKENKTNF